MGMAFWRVWVHAKEQKADGGSGEKIEKIQAAIRKKGDGQSRSRNKATRGGREQGETGVFERSEMEIRINNLLGKEN